MVRVIVYSRSMPRTPDAASESADTGTYRRSRSRASRQRSDAGASQRTASRPADHLPVPTVIARILLRISIAVDRRGLGAKLFSAEHPKNNRPTHHKKILGGNHDVISMMSSPLLHQLQ